MDVTPVSLDWLSPDQIEHEIRLLEAEISARQDRIKLLKAVVPRTQTF
jgi:hypothetical protein